MEEDWSYSVQCGV